MVEEIAEHNESWSDDYESLYLELKLNTQLPSGDFTNAKKEMQTYVREGKFSNKMKGIMAAKQAKAAGGVASGHTGTAENGVAPVDAHFPDNTAAAQPFCVAIRCARLAPWPSKYRRDLETFSRPRLVSLIRPSTGLELLRCVRDKDVARPC